MLHPISLTLTTIRKKALLSLLLLFTCISIYGADLFVDQTAPAGGDGTSWATAYNDIQSAVAAASSDDIIFIAEGVYRPVSKINITIPLSFIGGYPTGGGVQNPNVHITQLQADFDPGNLLPTVFDIASNANTRFSGLRFLNCSNVIESESSLSINQVQFEQISGSAVYLSGTGAIDYLLINNSVFSNSTGNIFRGFVVTLQLLEINQSIFDGNTGRIVSFGDDLANFYMRSSTIRNSNTTNASISLNSTTAIISDLIAENNSLLSGSIFQFIDSNLTIERSIFNNNTGDGTICLTGNGGQLTMTDSQFTNNNAVGTFPKPVMGISNVTINATNCLFENNFASGSQPNAIGQIRGDRINATTTIEKCRFINNTSTGSIANLMEIGYGAAAVIKDCVFDGNAADTYTGLNSVNPSGIELSNNIFRNHTVNEPLINMYDTNTSPYTVALSNNVFVDNTFTILNISRFENVELSSNQYIGNNIALNIDRIDNFSSTKEYFRGNTSRSSFMTLREITASINQMLMISTAANGTHTVIESGDNTSLNIVNSTFSSSNISATHVAIDFDDDLGSFVRNSIIWSGSSDLSQNGLRGTTGNINFEHSLVKGLNLSSAGNLNGTLAANQPVFVNPAAFDFRMQRCSPTVNQGLNSLINAATDLQGNARIFETNVDMGAYELQIPFNTNCLLPSVPSCTALSSPTNGETEVDVYRTITWNTVTDATGYLLTIGTNAAANNLVDVRLGNVTNFTLSTPLPFNTQIFVRLIPFNGTGNATSCNIESFFTPSPPLCTSLSSPANGSTAVPLDSNLVWPIITNATGYNIIIGTYSGGSDIVNTVVGATNTLNLPFDLPENTTLFITISPFNNAGMATSCTETSFTTEIFTPPACTTITTPADGATDVALDAGISWNASTNATGYFISIGTSAGASDVSANFDNGNATTYNPPADFQEDTTYFIIVSPYNNTGTATGCAESSFTTEILPTAPACTTITTPADGATDVALDAVISWNASTNATGYFISIGTSSGASDVLANFDNGNATTYNPPADFQEDTTYFITVSPYNNTGTATGCVETFFTTAAILPVPDCTMLVSPVDDEQEVPRDTNIEWNAVSGATGYIVNIGTQPGGNDFLANFDNGNSTLYNPPSDLPASTVFYVNITPYNTNGNALNCVEETFRTVLINGFLSCSTILTPQDAQQNVPLDTDLEWTISSSANGVNVADGYDVRLGTAPGLADVVNTRLLFTAPRYDIPQDLLESTRYYLQIIPFDTLGPVSGCSEITFTTGSILQIPECTSITNPLDASSDVATDTIISWNQVNTATNYIINIGTTPNGSEILADFDNGNRTSYEPPSDFPEDTMIYVRVTPSNAAGDASGCEQISFRTVVGIQAPECTSLINPIDGARDTDLDLQITWQPVANADGYFVSLGTTINGEEILTQTETGLATRISITDLPINRRIYVTITPFNTAGSAIDCTVFSFDTLNPNIVIPEFLTPNQDGFNDSWQIIDLQNKVVGVEIYDRYGKLLQSYADARSSWNGTFNNQLLPSSDYWYVIKLDDGTELKGHFTLKR